jgi:RHS repeat-associated protein
MSEENQQLYYYHGDHLGSAQIVTDPEGEIYEQLEYTPYGELWVEHLETTIETTPFRFTGKERDSETGLYYFGARYLNPQTGMWLSADPAMGEYIPQAPVNDDIRKQNQNLPGMGVFNYVNLHAYHYAGNNPVVLTDPDGRAVPAIVIKLLADAGIGFLKGAAYSVATRYIVSSTIRFLRGESFQSAFTPQSGDISTYLKVALKGGGEGALAGLLSNIPFLDDLAKTGNFGSGVATSGINMFTTAASTILENLIEGRDVATGLGKNITISGVLGFLTGLATPHGRTTGHTSAFNPISNKPYVTDKDTFIFTDEVIRAEIYEILGTGAVELLQELLE